MAHHNLIEEMSESIEMYLLRVSLLQEEGQPVPIPQLAQELSISPVSAHEMCRKLTDKGLVQYEPYRGVTLTSQGDMLAQRVLRCRRLWAVFLMEKLGIDPQEADEMACRFEHVTPDELADRLAAYLDIPELGSKNYQRQTCGLAQLTAGKRGRIVDLTADNVTNDFLKQQGIARGELITVLA
ncbi:MAG: metal-dependent transcriptional regulator, partial [Anaerolineae bacterium]|nr:metal-dependent transcriptional regulator [Anaerolineae bacterium]